MLDLQPVAGVVVLESVDSKPQIKGGLVLPVSVQQEIVEGRVVALGKGSVTQQGVRIPFDFGEGDIVLFNRAIPHQKIIEEGKEYLLVQQSAVVARRFSH